MGHIDTSCIIEAPRALTWEISNSVSFISATPGQAALLSRNEQLHSQIFRLRTPPDRTGAVHTYFVERILDDLRYVAYARRWGNPMFLYSQAVWIYSPMPGDATEVRSVQDFQLATGASVSDAEMEQLMRVATGTGLMSAKLEVELTAGLTKKK